MPTGQPEGPIWTREAKPGTARGEYRLLYDAGVSPDGVVENMRRLELDPSSIEAIVCSHGHFDHTTGIDGLIRTLGRTNMPVLIHPRSSVRA